MATGKFVTAINCIDGRAHRPVHNWLKASLDAEFVDRITEPGVDKALAGESEDVIEPIKKQVLISVNAHNSKTVAVVGHHDCAANPVSEAQHKQDIEGSCGYRTIVGFAGTGYRSVGKFRVAGTGGFPQPACQR